MIAPLLSQCGKFTQVYTQVARKGTVRVKSLAQQQNKKALTRGQTLGCSIQT